jgi:hypothetical protein
MAVPYGSGAGGFLSPRGVDFAVIGEAFEIVKRDWLQWSLFGFIGFLGIMAVNVLGQILSFPLTVASSNGGDAAAVGAALAAFPISIATTVLQYGIYGLIYGGFALMTAKAIRGETVDLSEGLKAFNTFGPLFLVGLLQGLAVVVGLVACCIGAIFAAGLVAAAPSIVIFERLSPVDAFKKSIEMAKPFWLMAGLFAFVVQLLSGLGVILCCIGICFTIAIAGCCFTLMYRDLGGSGLTPSFGGGGGATNYPREGGGYMPGYGGPVDPPAGS